MHLAAILFATVSSLTAVLLSSAPCALDTASPSPDVAQRDQACTSADRGEATLAPPDGDEIEVAVQAYLDTLRANGRFPGVSVGMALSDGRILSIVSGMADRETRNPLVEDSRFLAGSVGKTFFAAFALQLVEEGRLELDAPIAVFLEAAPWFDQLPNARDITVRMLLNHTSGLVRYEFDPGVAERITADPDKVWTPEQRLSYLFDTEAPFPAGEGWAYSDTNYIVLAMILEEVTGTEAYDEIRERFLAPLDLRNTVPSDRRVIPGLVQGYAGPDNSFGGRDLMLEDGRLLFNPQLEWAGGGFASTPVDLAVWARGLLSGRFHSNTLLSEMLDGVPTSAPDLEYGLGIMVRSTELGPAHGHGGFFPGYLSEVRHYPELGIAVAVQFNTSVESAIDRNPGIVAHEIADLVARHGSSGTR